METYVKELNANICKLYKLRSELMETTIDKEYFVAMTEAILDDMRREKVEYKKRNRKSLPKSDKVYPKNFEFWFNKYYDDTITLASFTSIYKELKNKLTIQTLANSYIRNNNIKTKQAHLEEDLHLSPRLCNTPIGTDINFERYGMEPFDAKEVYRSDFR